MFELFNNIWVVIISLILLYIIYNKINNLNKPFDKARFVEKYTNQKKLWKKLKNTTNISKNGKGIEPITIPLLASYYVGLN
jgi:hypothetical protein